MTKEKLMTRVKSLLQTAPESVLDFACDLVIEEICNYCNLPEVPDQLLNTAALMVRGLYNSTQLGAEQMQPAVKSVSRGDTSYSFASVAEQMAQLVSSGDFLTDYIDYLEAMCAPNQSIGDLVDEAKN